MIHLYANLEFYSEFLSRRLLLNPINLKITDTLESYYNKDYTYLSRATWHPFTPLQLELFFLKKRYYRLFGGVSNHKIIGINQAILEEVCDLIYRELFYIVKKENGWRIKRRKVHKILEKELNSIYEDFNNRRLK